MGGERTGKGKKGGEAKANLRREEGHSPNMLKVSFLCTFAYGVHIQSCGLKLPLPQALSSCYVLGSGNYG